LKRWPYHPSGFSVDNCPVYLYTLISPGTLINQWVGEMNSSFETAVSSAGSELAKSRPSALSNNQVNTRKESKEYFREQEERFEPKIKKQIRAMAQDTEFRELSKEWAVRSIKYQYPLHFRWLGRPILQFPQDIVAMQELLWKVRPEVVVETGIARGGTLVFYASILELLGNSADVVGIDIALRKHNRAALRKHPLGKKIKIIDGSSIDLDVVKQVHEYVGGRKAFVVLDSNHTHAHVLQELTLYNDLVRRGSYLIASDTFIDDFPRGSFPNRPWDKGNNPATAVEEFLTTNRRFKNDTNLTNKLCISACSTGYLKCVRDPK